jgi:hypothetical protein
MIVDWYLDLATRAMGGLLLITCACLLFSLIKERASEVFGAVRDDVAGNSGASDPPNEASKKEEVGRTADQSRAVRAAAHVIAIATNRNNVSNEHLLFYDFVTAAARAALSDPDIAETIGEKMRANVWKGSSKPYSSQRRPSGFNAEAA